MQHKVRQLDSKGNLTDEKVGVFNSDDLLGAQALRDRMGEPWIVHTENRPGYEVFRKDRRHYGLVLKANAGTDTEHFIAYLYLQNTSGDWDGDTYCSSRSYKTYKGACKRVRDYLDW